MQIPVLIEPIDGHGFRARGGEPFALSAEGSTQAEALQNLREQINGQIAAGGRVVPLEILSDENPWEAFAGMWKEDDPVVQEWLQIMAERRSQADAEELRDGQ